MRGVVFDIGVVGVERFGNRIDVITTFGHG